MALSRGDVLAFIDADCIADRNWLATIAVAFSDPTRSVIGGDVRIAFVDAARPTLTEAYESVFGFRQQEYIERRGFSATLNLAMRRGAFDRVGPFGGIEIAEDRDWGWRAAAKGLPTAFVREMLVFHPARPSMAELRRKTDRLLSHDYEERGRSLSGKLRWAVKAVAMIGSPVAEIPRILTSRKVRTPRERMLAALGLIRVRFMRSMTMLRLLLTGRSGGGTGAWNRS